MEAEVLMGYYCTDCLLKKYHRKEKGKRFAHRFCISSCTVGEKIKECGKRIGR
nr:zinc-finger domain-containing protein [Bacillus mediterraneensis]